MKSTVLFSLFCTACVTSYAGEKPLSFMEIQYPGKEDRVKLSAGEIAFVELNPDGKQTAVFIHGLGSNLKFWTYQLEEFAKEGYRVLALDLPGYGKSEKPATFPYTMEAMSDVVHEFIAAVDADRPVLIGHSMGGHIALTYAIRFPEELSALVLTSPAGFEAFSRKEKAWFKQNFSTALVKGASEEAIWGNVRTNNFDRWKSEYEWLIEERVRVAKSPEFDQYAYANVKSVQGLTQTDFVRQNLDKIKVPTLIIYGTRDRLIPNPLMHGGSTDDIMAFGHDRIKGSQIIPLGGCGHMVQMDCSAPYNDGVRAFLHQAATGTEAVARDNH